MKTSTQWLIVIGVGIALVVANKLKKKENGL
jgi:hypothetical protein